MLILVDRLDCQHFMYKMQYGYTMNPKIPIRNDMRIAEIGTGTASVSRTL